MASDDEEEEVKRRRRTLYLLTAGAVSLLLPLAGLAYLQVKSNTPRETTGYGAAIFDRRGGIESKGYIKAAETPAAAPPMAAPAVSGRAEATSAGAAAAPAVAPSGSLGMVKGGDDYYQDPKPEPPAPVPPPPAAPQIVEEEKAPAPKKKTAKKPMSYPKLQPTGSVFVPGKFGGKIGQKGASQEATPDAPGGVPDMAAMMNNLPKGTVLPDMGAMMQQMQQQGSQK